MATGGIQDQLLDITVVGCNRLKDTEWISRQDPYVLLEYANHKFQTKPCTESGKNPSFNVKFLLPMIEGLRELNVSVWNSNKLSSDDFIGACKVLLNRVLSSGYDDSTWPLYSRSGKNAGEVRIILHYSDFGKIKEQTATSSSAPPSISATYAPPCVYPTFQQPSSLPPPQSTVYPPQSHAHAPPNVYPSQSNAYHPPLSYVNPSQSHVYPPPLSNVYPPPPYYPPSPFGNAPYPPSSPYHPQAAYPPAQPYQGYYPGAYPPQ